MLFDQRENTVPEVADQGMTTKELLLRSAAYIREHGLAKGQYVTDSGAVCIQGAMHIVLGSDAQGMRGGVWLSKPVADACTAVMKHLKLGGCENDSIPWMAAVRWNNKHSVSKEEVVAGLESTAHAL